jgi:hypothetical protein
MKTKFALIAAILALFWSGFGNVATAAAQGKAANQYHSGFLADYARLKPVEGVDGLSRFVDKSVNLSGFTKLLIEPVQIYLVPNPEYRGLQPDALKRMTDAFQSAFIDATSGGYQIVTAPGADVLRVRLAITGVQAVAPPLNPTDFIPIKALFNFARARAGDAPQIAEISAELEVLTPDNRQVAAAVATRKSDKDLAQSDMIRWADLQPIVTSWAKNFRVGLDAARGIAPAK